MQKLKSNLIIKKYFVIVFFNIIKFLINSKIVTMTEEDQILTFDLKGNRASLNDRMEFKKNIQKSLF